MLVLYALVGVPPTGAADLRFGDVVSLPGSRLSALTGYGIDEIGLLACHGEACGPIPMQIDERDASGAWVLHHGAAPSVDVPAKIFDHNDVLLFMAADAGDGVAATKAFPAHARVAEIELRDPLQPQQARRVYAIAPRGDAATARRYVAHDPVTDRFKGARVQIAFGEAVPTYMSIDGGRATPVNVLDRLKVRAAASLFWGWLRFARNEDDLSTESVGWRSGPIRVIRYQSQRVRLGWGIRSPLFHSYTYFYRDYAELPVALRLRVPATYFFSDILIEVILDFRDLRGWRLFLPGLPELEIGKIDHTVLGVLNDLDDQAFALRGPDIGLVQTFAVSDSLDSVRKRFVYRESLDADPPESVVGAWPGVGYALERWDDVGAGEHALTVVSYAVPAEVDIDAFLRSRRAPLQTTVRSFAAMDGERRPLP